MYELVKAHPQGIGLAGFGWYWGKRWPEVSMKEMGSIMAALKNEAGSKIDMKMASQMVREIIAKQVS